MSYTDLDQRLTGRCRERRKVANNTYAERRGDDIALRLHQTDVVTFHPDGSITLNTGGWYTVTTKDRMNNALPKGTWNPDWCEAVANAQPCPGEYINGHYHGRHEGLRGHVGSVKGEWFVWWADVPPDDYWNPHGEHVYVYRDGITLHPDGTVTGAPSETEIERERKRVAWRKRQIKDYLAKITPEKIVYAWEHSGGDPWCCSMVAADGSHPMGEDCIAGHVQHKQFTASLAMRAVRAATFNDPTFIMRMIYADAKRGQVDDLLTRSLRKFLTKELVTGRATK